MTIEYVQPYAVYEEKVQQRCIEILTCTLSFAAIVLVGRKDTMPLFEDIGGNAIRTSLPDSKAPSVERQSLVRMESGIVQDYYIACVKCDNCMHMNVRACFYTDVNKP